MFQVKGWKKEDLRVVLEELLGEIVSPELKITDLKELILNNESYVKDSEFVKEILITAIDERREKAKEKANLELEKLKLEQQTKLELARIAADFRNENNQGSLSEIVGDRIERSLENMIKSVRTLTVQVPVRPEAWSLFFTSLERAFEVKNVPEEFKAEILINLLGEKAATILIYIKGEDLRNYEAVKTVVLREYEPSPQICLQNFRKANRYPNETHMQFCSRLTASWEYYCKIRKATDFKTLNELIISDHLLQTLDPETESHINIRQGGDWFRPVELAKECDIYFASKGKSLEEIITQPKFNNYSETVNSSFNTKYVPPSKKNYNFGNSGGYRAKECYRCGRTDHIARNCFQKVEYANQNEKFQPEVETNDVLVAKVETNYVCSINTDYSKSTVNIQPLDYVNITVNDREVEAILDSGTQVPVLHPCIVPNFEANGSIVLSSAFGEEIKASVSKVSMSSRIATNGAPLAPVDVMVAVTDKLKGHCLLPPYVFKMLEELSESKCKISKEEVNTDSIVDRPIFSEEMEQIADVKMTNAKTNKQDLRSENSDGQKIKQEQAECETLRCVMTSSKRGKGNFCLIDGIAFHREKLLNETVTQLVLPFKRREKILQLAHKSFSRSHMGLKKTKERIRYNFFWPNMSKDIANYCKTCMSCQLKSTEKASDRDPITAVDMNSLPFGRVNISKTASFLPSDDVSGTYNQTAVNNVTSDGTIFGTSSGERLSALLKNLFETHVSDDVNERLVKVAANGDVQKCEEISDILKKHEELFKWNLQIAKGHTQNQTL